jgi:hypothetical protein
MRTLVIAFFLLMSVDRLLADECGTVSCRDITSANSIDAVANLMQSLGTDCRKVRTVKILDKSTPSHAYYQVMCDDGDGVQQYQIDHEPGSREVWVRKFSGNWMDVKHTTSAPRQRLF